MGTKVKKRIDQTAKEQKYGRQPKKEIDLQQLERRERPLFADKAVIAAPIWRRLCAYIIDVSLAYGLTQVMLYAAYVPQAPMSTSILMLVSAFVMHLWLFGLLPGEYTPGQTLGAKLLGIYVRQVNNKKPLGIWRNMARGYFYGFLGAMLTIPFECISLVIQYFSGKTKASKTLQNLPVSDKALTLPRDLIFRVEVIYPSKKQVRN